MHWRLSCMYVYERVSDVEVTVWVLGTEPVSSERAACSLNHQVTSPAPQYIYIYFYRRRTG